MRSFTVKKKKLKENKNLVLRIVLLKEITDVTKLPTPKKLKNI